jgi:hypothetical protein
MCRASLRKFTSNSGRENELGLAEQAVLHHETHIDNELHQIDHMVLPLHSIPDETIMDGHLEKDQDPTQTTISILYYAFLLLSFVAVTTRHFPCATLLAATPTKRYESRSTMVQLVYPEYMTSDAADQIRKINGDYIKVGFPEWKGDVEPWSMDEKDEITESDATMTMTTQIAKLV